MSSNLTQEACHSHSLAETHKARAVTFALVAQQEQSDGFRSRRSQVRLLPGAQRIIQVMNDTYHSSMLAHLEEAIKHFRAESLRQEDPPPVWIPLWQYNLLLAKGATRESIKDALAHAGYVLDETVGEPYLFTGW